MTDLIADKIRVLRNAYTWQQACKDDGDRIRMILELASCAGDIACEIKNEKTRHDMLDRTLEVAQYIEKKFGMSYEDIDL